MFHPKRRQLSNLNIKTWQSSPRATSSIAAIAPDVTAWNDRAPNWHQRNTAGYLRAPPHDETGHTWHHNDKLLFELTKFGPKVTAGEDYKTHMPAYEGVLSDNEIIAVLSYIKSTWPEEVIEIYNKQINNN